MWKALIWLLVAAQPKTLESLGEDTEVERSIVAGESHRYALFIPAGYLLDLTAVQSNADVRLQLRSKNDELLIDMNTPAGATGPVPLGWHAQEDTEAVLVITAIESADGTYELRRGADSLPDGEDLRRLKAHRDMAAVRMLMDGGSADELSHAMDILEAVEQEWAILDMPWWRALTLQTRGRLKNGTGQSANAIEDLDRALALWSDIGDQRMLARTHNRLAEAHNRRANYAEAVSHLQQALPLSLALDDLRTASVTANSLGSIEWRRGHWDAAIAWYEQALPLRRATGYVRGEAITLNNLGTVFDSIGDYSSALIHYRQSLELRRQTGDRRGEAVVLNNIGELISNTGDPEAAIPYLVQALALRRETGDPYGEVMTLLTLGGAEKALGIGTAGERFNAALDLATDLENARMQAMAQRQLALLAIDEDRLDDAEALAGPARASAQASGNPEERLWSLIVDARILLARRSVEGANSAALSALELAENLDLPFEQVRALDILARAAWSNGLLEEATAAAERAVLIAESLRFRAARSRSDRRLRRELDEIYRLQVELRMEAHVREPQRGHDARALEAVMMGQSQFASAAKEHSASVPAALTTAWGKAVASLGVARSRLATARADDDAEAVEQALEELASAYSDVEQIDSAIGAAISETVESRRASLDSLRTASLEGGVLVLSAATEHSFAWIITSGRIESHVLGLRSQSESLMSQLNAIVGSGGKRRMEAQLDFTLRQLSTHVLQPLEGALSSGRLHVIADGPFASIPIAGLMIPGTQDYLVDRYEISLPVASIRQSGTDSVSRTDSVEVYVFSDPVFGKSLPRLANTTVEAEAIVQTLSASRVRHYARMDASRERFEDALRQSADVLHLATHALVNDRWPELSSLVFSLVDEYGEAVDGHYRVADLARAQVAADLVVLSACSTVPGPYWPGTGLRGLARGFVDAGANQVVAGLWPMHDRVLAEFMEAFYKSMYQDELSSAAALREAQRNIRERYPSPYYWAGFVHFIGSS